MTWRLKIQATVFVLASQAAGYAMADPWAAVAAPAAVVLFRHATAPGLSDPPGFRLDDCATQRNLDAAGRAEAQRIGERFRAAGIQVGAVLTSQWCRTRETAQLAFGPDVRDEPAFNALRESGSARDAQVARALDLLAAWRGPGTLVVITHQVNISAITGSGAVSAEGVVVRPAASLPWPVAGRLPP
ncbi:MAG TPA: histidine phosphatase family protein [Ramlibacter sp.]|jgi:phosphohistidine phosphatase SixA